MVFFLFILCSFFILHATASLYWLLYAWQDREQLEKIKTPAVFLPPTRGFTALVPARQEAAVIRTTLCAIHAMDYPEELKQVIVICRSDDQATIDKVSATIAELQSKSIQLVIFEDTPINKPHALNIGLQYVTQSTVVIFDAEDLPHPHLYQIANTLMVSQKLDVLQSGVQLMNYREHWYSALNVLEYFFWFKSTMHYFAKQGVIPLGGNTVFFDEQALINANGWDEKCLTEDGDIGIRLSVLGAKTGVTYDERYVTQEETPSTIGQLIKQRTRWNQGFLEIFLKRDWLKLPGAFKKILAAYIFTAPFAQSIYSLFSLFSIYFALNHHLPIGLVLYFMVPLYLLLLQLLTCNLGLFLFCRAFQKPYSLWLPIKLTLSYFFYQLILSLSAWRALYRTVRKKNNWEKTVHLNEHRVAEALASADL